MQKQYIAAEKACRRCGVIKPVGDFFPLSLADPRPRPHCKACHGAGRSKTWKADRFYNLSTHIKQRGGKRPQIPVLRRALGEPTTCYLCGGTLTASMAEADHVVPVGRGGTHDPANLRWAHRRCNLVKADLTIEEFITLAGQIIAYASRPQEHL